MLGRAEIIVGGTVDPSIGRDVAKSFDAVDDAIDDAAKALAKVQTSVDAARATTTRAFGELNESSNLARDGFGDLSTAASSVGSGLVATGLISETTGQQFTMVADTLGGVEGAFTAVKGASATAGSAITALTGATGKYPIVARAAAVAQQALNAVLRANPIGLIITALTLLVAGLVIAYKKSETFRAIVDAAFKAVKTSAVAVFTFLKSFITGAINAIIKVAGKIKSTFSNIWDGVKNAGSAAFDKLKDGINRIIGGINSAISAVNRIPGVDVPKIPMLAQGVRNFRGGLAVVGERGPELVNLPRGSDVFSNKDSQALGGSTVVVNQHNYGPQFGSDKLQELDWLIQYAPRVGTMSSSTAVA